VSGARFMRVAARCAWLLAYAALATACNSVLDNEPGTLGDEVASTSNGCTTPGCEAGAGGEQAASSGAGASSDAGAGPGASGPGGAGTGGTGGVHAAGQGGAGDGGSGSGAAGGAGTASGGAPGVGGGVSSTGGDGPTGPTCDDHMENGDESDVDCGGSCPGCDAGESCDTGGDCASGLCLFGACVLESQ